MSIEPMPEFDADFRMIFVSGFYTVYVPGLGISATDSDSDKATDKLIRQLRLRRPHLGASGAERGTYGPVRWTERRGDRRMDQPRTGPVQNISPGTCNLSIHRL